YSLAQRQSQAHSRPCGLGREERVEYTFEMLARDADAVVDDADHDERPVAALPAGLVLGDYADRAALALGRVGGVVEQVEQHLLDLVFVREGRAQLGTQHGIEGNPAKALVVGDYAERVGDELVDVDELLMAGCGAGEIHEVLEGSRDARDLREDRMQRRAPLRIGFAGEQRLDQRRYGSERIIHLVRNPRRERSRRRQTLALEQRVEHLAPLGHVVKDHLDELFVAVGDERAVHVEKERPDWHVGRVFVAEIDHLLQRLAHIVAQLLGHEVGDGPPHDYQVLLAREQLMELFGGRVRPQHLPGPRFDLEHRVRRMVYRVAILLLRRPQHPLARFDVELRNHQTPLVDRGHHRIAHPLLHRPRQRGGHVFENYLLESDVDGVELGGFGAGQHPFLAMPAKIYVGVQAVRVAQMGIEADERVAQAFEILLVGLGPSENCYQRLTPFVDDPIEMLIDQVGRGGANLHALWVAAVNRGPEQPRQQFLDGTQLLADYLKFRRGRFDWDVGWLALDRTVRRRTASAELLCFHKSTLGSGLKMRQEEPGGNGIGVRCELIA